MTGALSTEDNEQLLMVSPASTDLKRRHIREIPLKTRRVDRPIWYSVVDHRTGWGTGGMMGQQTGL